MIETNDYVAYDLDGHYYYLTEAGLTVLADIPANLWANAQRRAKRQGKMLYDFYTSSGYNGNRERYRHKDLIEYKIFKNEHNERQAIIDALVYLAEESEYDELDLKLRNGEVKWPISIINPLHSCGVYFAGEMLGYVPLEEYRVGY